VCRFSDSSCCLSVFRARIFQQPVPSPFSQSESHVVRPISSSCSGQILWISNTTVKILHLTAGSSIKIDPPLNKRISHPEQTPCGVLHGLHVVVPHHCRLTIDRGCAASANLLSAKWLNSKLFPNSSVELPVWQFVRSAKPESASCVLRWI